LFSNSWKVLNLSRFFLVSVFFFHFSFHWKNIIESNCMCSFVRLALRNGYIIYELTVIVLFRFSYSIFV
jgi:hypothetical protein